VVGFIGLAFRKNNAEPAENNLKQEAAATSIAVAGNGCADPLPKSTRDYFPLASSNPSAYPNWGPNFATASLGQLFYSFCLEEVVPDDHQVRAIASVLDLSWV
jgi:hypothetical protein